MGVRCSRHGRHAVGIVTMRLTRSRSGWVKFDDQLKSRVARACDAWLGRSTMADIAYDLGILPEDVSDALYIGSRQVFIDVDDATAKIILENQ